MNPSVSVIMAVFNGEAYVREAVNSILEQTHADFEFVIVNDGSTDGSEDILNRFADEDNRIRLIKHQANKGLMHSLREGISTSTGNLIARMDADDLSSPDRLAQQVKFLQQNSEYGLIGSCAYIINDAGVVIQHISLPTLDKNIRSGMQAGNIFIHGAVMFRRDIYDNVGGYDPAFTCSQDFDLWLRMLRHAKVANLQERLYQLRVHDGSVSRSKKMEQLELAARAMIFDRVYAYQSGAIDDRDPEEAKALLPARILHRIYARLAVRRGEYDLALSYYMRFISVEAVMMRLLLRSRWAVFVLKSIYRLMRAVLHGTR